MKPANNGAMRRNSLLMSLLHPSSSLFTITMLLILCFLLSSCQKEKMEEAEAPAAAAKSMGNPVNDYNVSATVKWELQQARAATAPYQNFDNAIADGYADIGVVVPNMGHHYMKASLLDGSFDKTKPEILVYHKHEDGSMELVAVEYAVPINLTPLAAPQGFTGSGDVWDRNTGFGLWLLHAWVWSYNPSGVFNPTNPLVHQH